MSVSGRTKVYELAKELSVDPQVLVETVQRLGIDIKNSMSILGSEEVRSVRDHYNRHRALSKSVAQSAESGQKPVTEKRVGATVIRRRAKAEPVAPEPKVVEPPPVVEEAPVEVAATETVSEEVEAAPEPQPTQKTEAPPAAPAAPVKRRIVSSIIKKVGTEEHLAEKIGPKIDRPKKEEKKPETTDAAGGPKRLVKEIEVTTVATEAAKEAGRRRLMDRQNTVFKSADYLKRELVHATKKKKAAMSRPAMKTMITTPSERKRVVEMGEKITVADLAKQLGIKGGALIGKLMNMGVTASLNESVDLDTATLVAHEYKYEVKQQMFREEDYVQAVTKETGDQKPRSPVVTIMGHVDHGKTSLLDKIRKANVASGEAGGITQHIGAYTVQTPKGKITFLDTPGHEAFTHMRARGAKATDIVILVVSAVDGVMPQTLESVNHAQAAGVPIVVAINKTDLPDGNPERVKQTLAGNNLAPEEWGGETMYLNVSAKTGKGIPELLDAVLLQAEVLELKASYDVPARGVVIESKLDKNKGALATVLVQHGVLKNGDVIVTGTVSGKVRAMTNSMGAKVAEAGPSEPVEIMGMPGVPNVGDEVNVVKDDKAAKEIVDARTEKIRASAVDGRPKVSLESMMATPETDKELRIILKSDVQGSGEALKEALLKFPSEKVRIKVVHTGTGGVTESDIMLAKASQAVVLGFNIRPDVKAQRLAEAEKIEIRTYSIIYELLDDLKKLLEGMLDKKIKEKVIGRAEVRNLFTVPKIGTVAGSAVIDGKIVRGCFLRLLRDSRVVYEGKISSLRRFKDDVKEVASGFECGIGLENFNDVKLGDQFEAFIKEETQDVL